MKAANEKAKKADREKLSAEEQLKADLDQTRKDLEAAQGELGKFVRKGRVESFAGEVAKLAPGIPAKRLAALLRLAEEDGHDIAPEHASPVAARKVLDHLKGLDPDSFKPAGDTPPPPGPGGMRQQSGSVDYRQRGAQVAGRK